MSDSENLDNSGSDSEATRPVLPSISQPTDPSSSGYILPCAPMMGFYPQDMMGSSTYPPIFPAMPNTPGPSIINLVQEQSELIRGVAEETARIVPSLTHIAALLEGLVRHKAPSADFSHENSPTEKLSKILADDETPFLFAIDLTSGPPNIYLNQPFSIEADIIDLQSDSVLPNTRFKLQAYTTTLSPVALSGSIACSSLTSSKVEVVANRKLKFSHVVLNEANLPTNTAILLAITAKDSSTFKPFVSESLQVLRDGEPQKRPKVDDN